MFKVVINFKTYKESTGENAVKLAKRLKWCKSLICCAQAVDLRNVGVHVVVFSQHVDSFEPGSYTGSVSAFSVKKTGASGTLLNHSECRLSFGVLKECVRIAKKNKLKVIVCAKDVKEVSKFKVLKPDFIAVEPPELIGGKVSVARAKPGLISKSVKVAGKIPLLCGAGIHSEKDIFVAKKLGAKGVLISSAIVKNKNPEKKLRELLKNV